MFENHHCVFPGSFATINSPKNPCLSKLPALYLSCTLRPANPTRTLRRCHAGCYLWQSLYQVSVCCRPQHILAVHSGERHLLNHKALLVANATPAAISIPAITYGISHFSTQLPLFLPPRRFLCHPQGPAINPHLKLTFAAALLEPRSTAGQSAALPAVPSASRSPPRQPSASPAHPAQPPPCHRPAVPAALRPR